jgi:hypothetical protein
MRRVNLAVATFGAVLLIVYAMQGGTTQEQAAFLVDAGFVRASHVATCPVRLSPECVALGEDSGMQLHAYERMKFPCAITALPDGGREIQLPPIGTTSDDVCVEVLDWNDCSIVPTDGGVFGEAFPFSVAGVTRKCVRAKLDAGLPCLRASPPLLDGGTAYSFGEGNVFERTQAVDPTTCEPVECVVVSGDDPGVEL